MIAHDETHEVGELICVPPMEPGCVKAQVIPSNTKKLPLLT